MWPRQRRRRVAPTLGRRRLYLARALEPLLLLLLAQLNAACLLLLVARVRVRVGELAQLACGSATLLPRLRPSANFPSDDVERGDAGDYAEDDAHSWGRLGRTE